METMMMEQERVRMERDEFYDVLVTEQMFEVMKSSKEIDPIEAEKKLIEIVVNDDREKLVRDSKSLFKALSIHENVVGKEKVDQFGIGDDQVVISRRLALRFLHISCNVDSVECAKALVDGEIGPGLRVSDVDDLGRTALHCAAEMHSRRCIELLLDKGARTDLRSRDESKQLPVELALSSPRMIRMDADQTIEDLLINLSDMDLSGIKMLAENTRGIAEVAYASALEGGVVSLAALLMVVPDKLTESFTVLRPDGSLASQETTTIYNGLIKEALSLGQNEGSVKRWKWSGLLTSIEQRKLLLLEIELLQLFGAAVLQWSSNTDRRPLSPLIRASQAGDEEVVKLLLRTNIDVNEIDEEGNSALHWHIKKSSNAKKLGILVRLIKNGANVRLKNRLGLTPLHIAADTGYFQALQVLLLKDPDSVHMVSEMKETALFFAVKHDFISCAELLLRSGSLVQIHNLRKQRPMDLANSKDMRFLLNQKFKSKSSSMELKESLSWVNDYQSDSDGEMWEQLFFSKMETLSTKRVSCSAKTDICMYFGSPTGCTSGTDCHCGKVQHHERNQGIKFSGSLSTNKPKHRIFVGGLPQNIDSETLKEVFQDQFGDVEDAKVITDQAGDHLFSRGFGFITFKSRESVAAAVELHYVNFWGKKVEIKGIVPKPDSPATTPKAKRQCQGPIVANADKRKHEEMSYVARLLHGQPRPQPHQKIDLTPKDPKSPLWLSTFKKWLPGFLIYVSKHLKQGEWYALSSVKSDFKARCGYNLDHASLGYSKLSDFMYSLSNICRVEHPPVKGRRAVSHMILLPALPESPEPFVLHRIPKSNRPPDSNSSLDSNRSPDFSLSSDSNPYPYSPSVDETENDNYDDYDQCVDSVIGETEGTLSEDLSPKIGEQNGGCGGGSSLLMALQSEKGEFSFFARQPTFFKEYREECLEAKKCVRCKINTIVWGTCPCRHVLWCSECMRWISQQGPLTNRCVICDATVEQYVVIPWQKVEQQTKGSTGIHVYDTAFPDLRTAITTLRKKK